MALGLALLAAAEAAADSPEPPGADPRVAYDPFQGMEPTGRIPKVALPPDLSQPSRWRYIPEGRIKPGNVFERFLVSSFAAPQFFFEEDVGVGAGIALTDIDFRNQRRREFLGAFFTYTTEGQQKYRAIWRRWLYHENLPQGGVVLEERSLLGVGGGYQKTLTRRFYGLGPDSLASDETSYIDEVVDLGARADFAVPGPGDDWVATLGVRGEHHNLAPGRVSGRPTTDQVFPGLFRDADGHSSLAVTAGLRYDTRDSQHQPYAGWHVGLVVDAPVLQSTGTAGAVMAVHGSIAIAVPPLLHPGGDTQEENPPTDTVAVGIQVATTIGDLPFFARPSLGGTHTLRGYIANRFTGDSAWHAVGEYRLWVIPRGFAITRTIRIERIGLAPFFELGSVADSLAELPRARVHTSYGVGLRVSLERTALFRVDLGFSAEGSNLSVGFGLSF